MGNIFSSSAMVISIIIVSIFIVGFAIVRAIVKCWHNVPPNMAAIVSGRKYAGGKGYKIVMGGGFFKIPVIERVDYLPLNVIPIPIEVQRAPDKNGVQIHVKGVANIKIASSEEQLPLAVERFLGKNEEFIRSTAKENLEASLRAMVGTLTVEELIRDRQKFQGSVLGEASGDMARFGLVIDLLNVQEIRDDNQYIESLGKKQTAGVVRDATIGQAEATRDADIKSAQARQEGKTAVAKSDEEISNAEQARDTVKAQNDAKIASARARVEIAAQTAAAEETKNLNIANVAAEQARVEAEINLQDAVRRRTEAELNATTIVQATKEKEARIIGANATKEAKIIEAEGEQTAATSIGEAARIKAEKEGQGEQAKMTAQAAGRIKQAEAVQAERTAAAEGEKAELLAKAAGKEADLMAEARGREAILLAEAKGTEAKADAFAKLDQAGRTLLIIEALPPVIHALGDAASKVIVPMAEAIGEGLGNVSEIRMVDLGGGRNGENGAGGNILSQFLNAPPATMFKLVEQFKAAGTWPAVEGLAKMAGIDLSSFMTKPAGERVAEVPAPATPAGTKVTAPVAAASVPVRKTD